jgi:hypothetical protein
MYTPAENLQAIADEARYQQLRRKITAVIWVIIAVSVYSWLHA